MKSNLLLLFLVLVFGSCTSLYKSGQTPDDVYFSPGLPQNDYVLAESKNNQYYNGGIAGNNYRYNSLQDDYYSYNPNYYQYSNNFLVYNNPYLNNTWGGYSYWNYNSFNPYYGSYDPYFGHFVIVQPATPVYNRPRMFNLNVYNPPASGNRGIRNLGASTPGSNGNGRTNNYNPGSFLRNVFNSGGSSNQGFRINTSNPSSGRSTPAPSSAPGSGSRSGSAPVRHF